MEDLTLYTGNLLRDFRYKADWGFEVKRTSVGPWLDIQVLVPDSRRPARAPDYTITESYDRFGGLQVQRNDLISIKGSYAIPRYINTVHELRFWEWLRGCIKDVELHEMDEWFRVRGELMFDPH